MSDQTPKVVDFAECESACKERDALYQEVEFLTKKMIDLNTRLEKAESNKATFVSLVQNVFNNPLAPLLNLSKHLSEGVDVDKCRRFGGIIRGELLKMDYYFRNIIEVSTIESGTTALQYARVSPREKIDEAIAALSFIPAEKPLRVTVESTFDDTVVSDPAKLGIILLDLLSNAMEYAYPDTDVRVTLGSDGSNLLIGVANRGETIRVAHKNEVFNRFVMRQNPQRVSQGLGIGLSIVRSLVEELGGTVDFTSEADETRFSVVLPLVPPGCDDAFSVDHDEIFFGDSDTFKEF